MYSDFQYSLDEATFLPPGFPVRMESVNDRKKEHLSVTYYIKGPTNRHAILRIGSQYCFFDGHTSRLHIDPSSEEEFLGGCELFFTGVSLSLPIMRLQSLEHFHELKDQSVWYNKILHAEASDPPSTITYDPSKRHQYAIDTTLESKGGILLWHGPPGTGKTLAIAKLVKTHLTSGKDVLLCAHSNESVFNLVSKLISLDIPTSKIYWALPLENEVDYKKTKELRMVINPANYDGRSIFVSTCTHSHTFSRIKKFRTLILDEAGFCPEIDLLVAIKQLDTNNAHSKLILVGDPNQLPPVIKMYQRSQLCGSLMGRCSVSPRNTLITFNVSHRVGSLIATFLRDTFYSQITDFVGCDYTPNLTLLRDDVPFPEITFIDVCDGQESLPNTGEQSRTTNVGFLDDPHLMCVCLSRQKVFLVVVGNAKLLRCIPIWSTFFDFITDQANAQIVTPQWLESFKA